MRLWWGRLLTGRLLTGRLLTGRLLTRGVEATQRVTRLWWLGMHISYLGGC